MARDIISAAPLSWSEPTHSKIFPLFFFFSFFVGFFFFFFCHDPGVQLTKYNQQLTFRTQSIKAFSRKEGDGSGCEMKEHWIGGVEEDREVTRGRERKRRERETLETWGHEKQKGGSEWWRVSGAGGSGVVMGEWLVWLNQQTSGAENLRITLISQQNFPLEQVDDEKGHSL